MQADKTSFAIMFIRAFFCFIFNLEKGCLNEGMLVDLFDVIDSMNELYLFVAVVDCSLLLMMLFDEDVVPEDEDEDDDDGSTTVLLVLSLADDDSDLVDE